jgi:folate-binding protein YgfZ
MSYNFLTLLPDRGLLEIKGPDAAKFLQGLITNDIDRCQPGGALFAGLLTPKGKIISDFLIFMPEDERYWIDCPRDHVNDLVKRFSLYKLRAKVEIVDLSADFSIVADWGNEQSELVAGSVAAYADPRYAPLGRRAIIKGDAVPSAAPAARIVGDTAYHSHRIASTVPQGGLDYVYGEAFPHEACYDDLHGVDFRKGCYVGQEVVSRMHHKGIAKTRIAAVEASAPLEGGGAEISAGDQPVGRLGSVDGTLGVALIRLDRVQDALDKSVPLRVGEIELTVGQPPWASYPVPAKRA